MADESEEKVCTFFKKRRTNAQIRGKATDKDEEAESKEAKENSDSELESKPEKRPASPETSVDKKAKDDESNDDEEENSDTDLAENLSEMKRKYGRNKQSALTQTTKTGKTSREEVVTKFEANKAATRVGPDDMGATAVYNLDTEFDRDARAVMERAQKINDELKSAANDDKVYRGLNNYQQFIKPRETAQGKAFNPKGPIRAPTNLRVLTQIHK